MRSILLLLTVASVLTLLAWLTLSGPGVTARTSIRAGAGLSSAAYAAAPPPPRPPRRPTRAPKPPRAPKPRVVKPVRVVPKRARVVKHARRLKRVRVIRTPTVVRKTTVVGGSTAPVVVQEPVTTKETYYVPAPLATTKDVELAAYFAPGGGPKKATLAELQKAVKEVLVAMRDVTDAELADALAQARKRGVNVAVLVDANASSSCSSCCEKLLTNDVDVRLASAPGGMNNAFAVIDRGVLLVGSYNWTTNACQNNCENLLVVRNSAVASHYASVFDGLWSSPEATSTQ